MMFQMPTQLGRNGSFSVNTVGILSEPGCVAAQPVRRPPIHPIVTLSHVDSDGFDPITRRCWMECYRDQ